MSIILANTSSLDPSACKTAALDEPLLAVAGQQQKGSRLAANQGLHIIHLLATIVTLSCYLRQSALNKHLIKQITNHAIPSQGCLVLLS
jgi:hypothetical protein